MSDSPAAVIYLFYGQDEPALREKLAAFCAEVLDPTLADLNLSRLDGRTAQPGEIQAAGGAIPFLADTRVVLVENLSEAPNGKTIIDELAVIFPTLPDSTRLVFVETNVQPDRIGDSPAEQKRKAARRQAIKRLSNVIEKDPRGKVISFDLPDSKNLARWVAQRAAYLGVEIEPDAASLLAELINDDLVLANSELEKLAVYTNGARPIQRRDIEELTPYSPEASIFAMVDALGQRDGGQALTLLHRLLNDGDDPLRIFAMIVRQYRLLLLMREQLDAGQNLVTAAEAVGVQGFVARKLATQCARYSSIGLLERIYHILLETDEKIKTGRMSAPLALEELVARLAR